MRLRYPISSLHGFAITVALALTISATDLHANEFTPIAGKVESGKRESLDVLTRCAGLFAYEIAILTNRQKVNRYKVQQARIKSVSIMSFADLVLRNSGMTSDAKIERRVAASLGKHLDAYLTNAPLGAALKQYPWLGKSIEGRDKMYCNAIVKKYF